MKALEEVFPFDLYLQARPPVHGIGQSIVNYEVNVLPRVSGCVSFYWLLDLFTEGFKSLKKKKKKPDLRETSDSDIGVPVNFDLI